MTTTTDANKEGTPWQEAPVPMTPEQLFIFDIRGWLVLPSVLSESETEVMRAEAYAGAKDNYSGELQRLLDHPAITGILTEILFSGENPIPYTNEQPKESLPDDTYRFRCESSAIFIREAGWKKHGRADGGLPHVGNAPQQAHVLRYHGSMNPRTIRMDTALTATIQSIIDPFSELQCQRKVSGGSLSSYEPLK